LSGHYWARPHRVHLRQPAAAPGAADFEVMELTAADTSTRM
jgi:hypothetical protein